MIISWFPAVALEPLQAPYALQFEVLDDDQIIVTLESTNTNSEDAVKVITGDGGEELPPPQLDKANNRDKYKYLLLCKFMIWNIHKQHQSINIYWCKKSKNKN